MKLRLFASMVLLTPLLAGGDLESWNYLDASLLEAGPVEVEMASAVFVREGVSDLYDRRGGLNISIDLNSIEILGGYMLRHRDRPGVPAVDFDHRFVAGVSYPLYRRYEALAATTAFERAVGLPDRPDYNRYRQRFYWERDDATISPFVYSGFLWERSGFVRYRSRVGVALDVGSDKRVHIGYQFESNKNATGVYAPRHAVYTKFSLGGPLTDSD